MRTCGADNQHMNTNRIHVEVTGWNADDESVAWDGYGDNEDEAVDDAMRKGRIVEIGDVTVLAS